MTFQSHIISLPPSPLPTCPNHYMTCLDPIPLAVVKDYLNIAYIRFQVGINDLNNSEAKSVTSKAVTSPSYKEALQTIFFSIEEDEEDIIDEE